MSVKKVILAAFLSVSLVAFAAIEITDPYYQLGDHFDKKPISQVYSGASAALQKLIRATLKAGMDQGGATAFYLGKYNGKHVFGTNYHVYAYGCRDDSVKLVYENRRVICRDLIGSWKEIDFALVTISIPPDLEEKLRPYALDFDYEAVLAPGQRLATVGNGDASNPRWETMAEEGPDCKVNSPRGSYRLMKDMDRDNMLDYRVWSFAHGCETSHGDSGSALVDRETGKVVGVAYTAALPKARKVQDSAYVNSLEGSDHADVWTLMNYAVPSSKIREVMQATVDGTKAMDVPMDVVHSDWRGVLTKLLLNQRD